MVLIMYTLIGSFVPFVLKEKCLKLWKKKKNSMVLIETQYYTKVRAKKEATLLRREHIFWKPHKIGNKESQ